MALDTSIYGNIQPVQIQNPLAQMAQAAQLQAAQYGIGKAQREDQAAVGLAEAYKTAVGPDGKIDRNKLFTTAAQGGYGAQIPGIQKTFTEQDKAEAELKSKQQEMALKRHEYLGGAMGYLAQNPAEAPMVLKQLVDAEVIAPDYPEKVMRGAQQSGDPVKFFTAGAQAALSAKEKMQADIQRAGQAITVRGQDLGAETSRRGQDIGASTAAAGQAVTTRGQDLTDARQREANETGRAPSGYRFGADKVTLEFVPGGPADPASKGGGKPLTEGQSKALLFGTRMKESNEILEGLASGKNPTDRPGWIKRTAEGAPIIGKVAGAATNWTQSEAQQQVEQAQRDFINATLRRESGAVISPEEFDNARKQYFPQTWDEPKNIAQKKRNREVAMRGILEEVPDAEQRIARVQGQRDAPAAAPPKVAKTGGTPAPKSAAEMNALPSGTLFTAPDGSTRRKP